jgi:hypothetical protein
MTPPVALSYAFLSAWRTCPHQAARRYIIKDIPYQSDDKRSSGKAIYKSIASYLKGAPLPEVCTQYASLLEPLLPHNIKPEQKLAITGQLEPISFFDNDAWLRGVIDAYVIKGETAVIFDWKTGKEWEDPFELEIFGLLLKSHHRALKKITGYYVWLRDGKLSEEHDLSDYVMAWGKVIKFHDEIEAGNFEKKTPGPLCKWCPVLDCAHNRKQAHDLKAVNP